MQVRASSHSPNNHQYNGLDNPLGYRPREKCARQAVSKIGAPAYRRPLRPLAKTRDYRRQIR